MRVDPSKLTSHGVALEPLTDAHAPELAIAAGTIETFRYFTKIPTPFDADGFASYGRFLIEHPTTVPFAVRDTSSGELVGMTSYCDIRDGARGVEIGWTWYALSARGTSINPACKYLLLRHAFEEGPFDSADGSAANAIRVQIKTDERNAQSRAAIEKLGARFEGILRNQVIMPDGHFRQTAMYSITEAEWATAKARLELRLA
ncbi:MAG: N-acetyltransferase [Phycisphaerae bacterium]|nr:N-acetyltransferase [Phycisphaerae bacterium]